MDYERGLKQLIRLARNTSWFEEAALLEVRLLDNLDEERYGRTEQTRANRMRIIDQLNRLTLKHLDVTFIELCRNDYSKQDTGTTPNVLEEPERADGLLDNVFTNYMSTPQRIADSTPLSSPTQVFVGYSSRDRQYLEELRTHLAQGIRAGKVVCWDDTEIQPGATWRQEVKRNLQTAQKAILLVSAHFLASNFILHEELPQLLALAKSKKLIIISVIVRPCRFNDTELAQFRTVNLPSEPLSAMNPSKRDEVWVKVVEYINLAR